MADTDYEITGDSLTLITPDPRFRVEFYAPYETAGDQHSFNYAWNAGLDVEEMIAEIQQPLNAGRLTTQPPAATVGTGPNDGLTYHALPAQALPAGTPFEMSFSYDMSNPALTVGEPAPSSAGPSPAVPQSESSTALTTDNWPLIGAGVVILLLVIAVTWLLATRSNGKRRKSSKPRKPTPKERASAQPKFCYNCGTQSASGDQFCRSCGVKLK
jgi:hypothetical protein